MEDNLEELVATLDISPLSTSTTNKIASILNEQTSESIPSILSNKLQCLLKLEHWAWEVLSQDFRQWIDEQNCCELFHALHSWNIKLISIIDTIQSDIKMTLLIPSKNEWIDGVLDQIKTGHDTFLTIASLWFEGLAYLVLEQPEVAGLPAIIHINNRLTRDFIMNNQYKSYLQNLHQSNLSQLIITKKQMFYIKTCSFSLGVYFSSRSQNFPFTSQDIVEFLADDYSQMIVIHSNTLGSWNTELLSCITHVTGLITSICWWGSQKTDHIERIFPSKDSTHSLILILIRILKYEPFLQYVSVPWHNDQNMLISAILALLIGTVETQNLGYFFSSETNLPATVLTIAQTSSNGRILLYAYGFLAIILSNEQLKELKIADNICRFFFDVLEAAWKHPTKKWKKISIPYLLKGLLNLATNDTIQMSTADLKKVSLLIEMCEDYSMIYDILWSLSFNKSIQEQLRSNSSFMVKLAKLGHELNDSNIRRSVNGILWLLDSNRDENIISNNDNDTQFDVMISYAHKDKEICKQVYDELIQAGYRTWIDFNQLHGNVIDAMAHAIEQSHSIIICMSEHYQRSNYCRAEAQYAFQRKLKMVPILIQKQYKPNGWLSFIVSQLLYVDFTKYEFSKAIQILFKELKLENLPNNASIVTKPNHSLSSTQLPSEQMALPKNIRDWNASHVHRWLIDNGLPQMARILSNVDGSSLIYLSEYIINGDSQRILLSLQQDSHQRTNETLSLVEMARFRSLIEKQGLVTMMSDKLLTSSNPTITNSVHSKCCNIM